MESNKKIDKGFFITFEGGEGAGKSTQVGLLVDELGKRGFNVFRMREPGGTKLCEELRGLVKHLGGDDAACPVAEMLIMGASRAQLVEHEIKPVLQAGDVVVCDRFMDSTTVYQGYARGLDLDFISAMHEQSVAEFSPNLTFYLDLDVKVGMERSRLRMNENAATDRFEAESVAFHENVRSGFLELAKLYPQRIKVIDAAREQYAVHEQIMGFIDDAFAGI